MLSSEALVAVQDGASGAAAEPRQRAEELELGRGQWKWTGLSSGTDKKSALPWGQEEGRVHGQPCASQKWGPQRPLLGSRQVLASCSACGSGSQPGRRPGRSLKKHGPER